MAELAAIGLASNILQFLGLGIKIFGIAREIHKSASGLSGEDEYIIKQAEGLKALANLIHEKRFTPSDQSDAITDPKLRNIIKSCDDATQPLINALGALRVEGGNHPRLASIRAAVRKQFRRTDIENMKKRLEQSKQDMIIYLTVASRNVLDNLKTQNDKLEARTTTQLDDIQSQVRKILESGQIEASSKIDELTMQLDTFVREAQLVKKQQIFLNSLVFKELRYRRADVRDRHQATFNWAYDENTTNFSRWLESEDGIFWVRGKPESGKSTLMKFLASNNNTMSKLENWAETEPVITASHFFYHGGQPMQKSLIGLWQTLLYEVLKECPQLIEVVSPSRWTTLDLGAYNEPWDAVELREAFEKLSQESLSLKFCFFIDGLDEYTDGVKKYRGDHGELIRPLKTLVSSRSIKICVSSRPWNVFKAAFGNTEWKLQLEDFTKEDIRRYVMEELTREPHPHFERLLKADNRCAQIAGIIVTRAEGVFLWVFLVVMSVKRGFHGEDNYQDLMRRLNLIPNDLEEYFTNMLESIDKAYWEKATRVFKVLVDAEQSLPLLSFDYLEKEMNEPGYATRIKTQTFSAEAATADYERLKTRLNACCQDLLYVTCYPEELEPHRFQIDFLHRTVRDFFLQTSLIGDVIKVREPLREFHPYLSLCKIMLALSKAIANDTPNLYNNTFLFGDGLMYYAQCIEQDCVKTGKVILDDGNQKTFDEVFQLLEELDRSNSERFEHLKFHWTNLKDPPKGFFQEYGKKTFLATAIQARLSMFVKAQLGKSELPLRQKRGRPLLDYALRPTMVTPLKLPGQEGGPVVSIVRYLLDLHADPDVGIYIYNNRTAWELFLVTCDEHVRGARAIEHEGTAENIRATIELMINRGADVDCTIRREDGTIVGFLDLVEKLGFSQYQIERIRGISEEKRKSRTWLPWLTSGLSNMFRTI